MLGGQGTDSWDGLHFGASDLQFREDDFMWQVQHVVWPGITFSWQAQYFRHMGWKNCKTHRYEAVSSHSTFHYWRESRRTASFLMLPTSKIQEFSQDFFVFDVANITNWGSLAEMLPFWRYQVQQLGKSRRIASFSSLQIANRQIDRQTNNRQTDR